MFAIAIDGPAGAGKSTVAKEVAKKLEFVYVDTGAIYRTLAYYILKNNIDINDVDFLESELKKVKIKIEHEQDGQKMYLLGEDITEKIRTPEITMMASTSSAIPCVRAFLLSLQTDLANEYNVVMDGRDIGTVVLPNAQLKVFLTASPEERARRRTLDFKEKGIDEPYEKVLAEIKVRDCQDSNREIAPLKPAEDAVVIDSSRLSFDEVVEEFIKLAKKL
ncbi:MAG: (d)CMP kinase [Clostridia bacterium]